MKRIDAQAQWYDDEEQGESPRHQPVSLRLGYGDDVVYIDGLQDGKYLCLPLASIARAIAAGTSED
jgi:hypothetical protein